MHRRFPLTRRHRRLLDDLALFTIETYARTREEIISTQAEQLMELSLTRIFSVVFAYHFAFLAISIALFGLGLGGVASYVVAGWNGPLFTKLGWLSGANSILVILSLALILGQGDHPSYGNLALMYFATPLTPSTDALNNPGANELSTSAITATWISVGVMPTSRLVMAKPPAGNRCRAPSG